MTTRIGNRRYTLRNQPSDPVLEIGPAGVASQAGIMTIQFTPTLDFDGQFVVVGRCVGTAAETAQAPFVPIPYRRVSLNNEASDRALVSDPINGTALIEVPANGITVGLIAAWAAGQCDVLSWDVSGSSST